MAPAEPLRRAARRSDARRFGGLLERLDEEQRARLARAARLDGLDEEIAILRFTVRELLASRDYREVRQQVAALARALIARYELGEGQSEALKALLARVVDEARREQTGSS